MFVDVHVAGLEPPQRAVVAHPDCVEKIHVSNDTVGQHATVTSLAISHAPDVDAVARSELLLLSCSPLLRRKPSLTHQGIRRAVRSLHAFEAELAIAIAAQHVPEDGFGTRHVERVRHKHDVAELRADLLAQALEDRADEQAVLNGVLRALLEPNMLQGDAVAHEVVPHESRLGDTLQAHLFPRLATCHDHRGLAAVGGAQSAVLRQRGLQAAVRGGGALEREAEH